MLAVIAAGLALHLPTINMGFFVDDYGHQIILRGISQHQGMRPWSLFDFGVFPTPQDEAWELGVLPWWTSPDWKGRFFRPLTSVTLWLDYALFGEWAPGYHLTSLVWYAGLLLLVYALYRSLGLAPRTALLGLALFAASDNCVFNVAWPANRNGLLAVFFIVASVLALTRYKVWGRAGALLMALLLAFLACLAKESGISAFAVMAAYLWWQRRRAQSDAVKRWAIVGILASLAAAALYVAFLFSQGYGTNTVFYSPPWDHPGEYLLRMGKLLSIGALSLAGPFNVDLLAALPRGLAGVAAISFVLAAGLAWVIFRNTRQHATAVFLAAWMAITVLPQGGAPPAERLLFGVSVGSSGLLAMFLSATVFQKAALWRPRLSRTLGWAVLLSAGPLSAVSVPVQGFVLTRLTGEVRQTIVTAQVPPPNHRQREVFVLQSPSMLVPLPMGQTWVIETDDRLARFWPMQSGRRGLRWTRLDERTFELESLDQPFLANIMEKVFLSGRSAPIPGAKWETALFTVEAVETGPDGLRRFRVRCPDSLDAPGYRFLVSPDGRLEAIPPPQVGQAVLIPTAAPFHRFMP